MFGLLNVDKPAGCTSRDIVNRVQRVVRPIKVGHAGTLDPLATGVLVICLGSATRLVEYVQRMPKTYRGTFLLGQESETEDIEGTIHFLDCPPTPTADEIRATLTDFVGTIQQVPPVYSALKISGRRAYELARQGEVVQLQPRPVDIYSLELRRYEYPEMVLDIRCGSGTYVRSLGRDVAARLETAAVMSALRRTAVGDFHVDSALSGDDLSPDQILKSKLPPLMAMAEVRQVQLNGTELEKLRYGGQLVDRFALAIQAEVAAVGMDGQLLAVLEKRSDGLLRPKRNFAGR